MGFAVIVLACLAAGMLATVLQSRLFGAEGKVVVSPARFLNPDGADALPALTDTVTELGTGAAVLELIATAYADAAPDDQSRAERTSQASSDWLEQHLRFRRVGLSSVIEITGTAATRADAVQLTGAAVRSLTRFVSERRARDAVPDTETPGGIELVILSLAEPQGRVSPTPIRNLLVGLIAGCLFGGVFAVAYGRFRKSGGHSEVASDLGIPSLGHVGGQVNAGPGILAARGLLEGFKLSHGAVAVLLTGTVSTKRIGEAAENLVLSLDGRGWRALLVDGDLGGQEISRRHGLADLNGLSDVLARDATSTELRSSVIQAQRRGNGGPHDMAVLPAGPSITDPTPVIDSRRLSLALDSLWGDFDFVVIGGPNVARLSEVFALLPLTDHWLLLVDSDMTYQQLADVRVLGEEASAHALGVMEG